MPKTLGSEAQRSEGSEQLEVHSFGWVLLQFVLCYALSFVECMAAETDKS